jgi:predicted Zn-dependent protease
MRTLLLALCCLLCGCVTTTEKGAVGVTRSQFMGFISSEQVVSMANQSYSQTKLENQNKGLLDQNPEMVARVKAIALKLIPTTAEFRKDAPSWAWEVHVITSSQLNAYCMPGGKIMFYSGLIEGLHLSDGEIATVMGHEISHALREHGRERMSEQMAEQGLVVGLETIGVMDPKYAQIEQMGVELMARAGYDPRESLHLWRKMDSAAGGSKPPEFLSTHPADKRRIQQLEILMPKVVPLYEKTRS